MNRVLVAVLVILTSLSCRTSNVPSVSEDAKSAIRKTLLFQNRLRNYFLHLPPAEKMNKPMPVLFNIHGGGGKAKTTPGFTFYRFNEIADKEGFIVVYPDAVDKNWNDGRSENLKPENRDVDDVGFIVEIINRLKADYTIDEDRIFTSGISNGGFMSTRLLCDRADLFRGGAILTATLSEEYLSECQPSQPVAVLLMNGTDDPLVPYDGGMIRLVNKSKTRGEVISTDDYLEFWKDRNSCEIDTTIKLPNSDKRDDSTVSLTTYKNCDEGGALRFYKVNGGGHTWPGGKQYLPKKMVGTTNRDINACDEIWKFFSSLD